MTFDKAVYLFFFNYLQPEETLSFPSWTACGDNLQRALSISRQRVMGGKSQTCSKSFILPDCITQIGRAVDDDDDNNEDVIKVKYLILTRLKAEYSNLIIMAGCSALNQQLLWENAPILMRKHQKKAKAKGRKSVSDRRTGIQSKHCMCYDKSSAFSYHCYV